MHPSGKKYTFPVSFAGSFDLQQPAVDDPPTPATVVPIAETFQLAFKLLRGSNDPDVVQLTVLGDGQNQFGSFQMSGTLDLVNNNGTMMMSV